MQSKNNFPYYISLFLSTLASGFVLGMVPVFFSGMARDNSPQVYLAITATFGIVIYFATQAVEKRTELLWVITCGANSLGVLLWIFGFIALYNEIHAINHGDWAWLAFLVGLFLVEIFFYLMILVSVVVFIALAVSTIVLFLNLRPFNPKPGVDNNIN